VIDGQTTATDVTPQSFPTPNTKKHIQNAENSVLSIDKINQLVEDFYVGKYFDLSQSAEEETAKNDIVDELSYTL
jgi:hypothetical protein